MGRISERIIILSVSLFLLAYVGYQAYRYLYDPVGIETVHEYDVSRAIYGKGIAIRDEMVLSENVSGVESYLNDDAAWVSIGQTVAEFYRSSTGDRNMGRARELEDEIELLREAQDASVANIGNTEIYNRDIKDQIGRLSIMSSAGKYQDLTDFRRGLTSLINKRLIATGKASGFDERISRLESELESLRRSISDELVTTVQAPVSGYFSKTVDGYENRVLLNKVGDYTLDDYIRMIESPPPAGIGGKTGKMVLSQIWYYAAAVPKDDIEWLKSGRSARLQFDHVARHIPATMTRILTHKDSDDAILLFQCDQMTEDVINLRSSGATIHFEQLSGLRISSSWLRFVEDQRGVYVLEDNVVRFRRIDPIYEEQGFVLSELYTMDSPDSGHIRLFDQVIVKGKDLYDGKVIQDYSG